MAFPRDLRDGPGTATPAAAARTQGRVVFRAKKPWWIASAVFLTATMALYSATGVYLLRRDGALLDAERKQLRQREQIDKHIQDLRARQAAVLTNAVPLTQAILNGLLAREVLTLSPTRWTRRLITMFCDENIYNPTEQDTTQT